MDNLIINKVEIDFNLANDLFRLAAEKFANANGDNYDQSLQDYRAIQREAEAIINQIPNIEIWYPGVFPAFRFEGITFTSLAGLHRYLSNKIK